MVLRPVAAWASRSARSTASDPLFTSSTVSSRSPGASEGLSGSSARSRSLYSASSRYRNREFVLRIRICRFTASATRGCPCPSPVTLFTMSTYARPVVSTRWCRQPRSICGGRS